MTGLRRWLPVLIAAIWLAMMVQIIRSQLHLSNDVSKFVADSRDARVAWIGRQLADSELTKSTILVIGAESGDPERALAAADEIAQMLAARDEVAWVASGWDPALRQAIDELYFPRRFHFATEDPATLDERLSDAGLERTAREVAQQLRDSNSEAVENFAHDPLLLHPAQLHRLEQLRDAPVDAEGRFVTRDGRAVVFLTTVHSPFDFNRQRPLQAAIKKRFTQLDRAAQLEGDDLSLIQSGVSRLALQAESQVRGDIGRISMISIVGVIALFLLLFRSPRMLVLAMLPLLAGFLTATGLCLLLFGELHVLTLAFGASLIGVCIDYPIHLFTHHMLHRRNDPREVVAAVRPGLLLGALTTIAGFLGMGWAAFPGIREISGFAALGILAALATTLWVLPSLLPGETTPTTAQRRMMARVERIVASMSRARRTLVALPLGAIVIMAIGLPRLRYQDDVSMLVENTPELLAEEEEVRSLVSRMDGGRVIVAFGDDDEEALLRNAEIHRRLGEAAAAGELSEFRSLHDYLWPKSVQEGNREHFCAREDLLGALGGAYVRAGLPGDYPPFEQDLLALCRGTPAALDWATLADSALGPMLTPLRLEYGRKTALFTYVAGVEDIELLRARMAGIEDVVVYDQRSLLTELYGRHRSHTIELVGLGLLMVVLILFTRHGEVGSTVAAVTPSILAAGMTLALLALFDPPITLMHVVGLVLVLSMGVDYGVFLTEGRGDPHQVTATVLSLLACCVSTVLSIGLLGLSNNPALQALGTTIGLGVLFSLILAPTALVLLGALDSRFRR
jgi:predicted exporter